MKLIKGYWLQDDSTHGGRTQMLLELHLDGTLTWADNGMQVRAEQWGNDAPIITNGVWMFEPDAGEFERIGVTPAQKLS